jgi:hypothetical protein
MFLLCARPVESVEDTNIDTFSDAYWYMNRHRIGAKLDSRCSVTPILSGQPQYVLHPKLIGLAEFLRNVTDIVSPEYAYLKEPPPVDHLHEALQRLLLTQVFAMEDDPIPLDTENHREE